MSYKDTDEFKEFIEEEAFAEFVTKESRLLKTIMGARNMMLLPQWQALKCSVDLSFPGNEDDESFDGVYTLLEDITGLDLDVLISEWRNLDLFKDNLKQYRESRGIANQKISYGDDELSDYEADKIMENILKKICERKGEAVIEIETAN